MDLEKLKRECERTTPSGGWSYVLDAVPELIARVEELEAREDLTTAYMTGFHKRDDEVRALQAKVETLEKALDQARYFIGYDGPYVFATGHPREHGGHFPELAAHLRGKEKTNG